MNAINRGKPSYAPVQPSKESQQVLIYRLSQQQYQELERKVLVGQVREDTSPVQSGFYNGIEHVLRKLREGFTVA